MQHVLTHFSPVIPLHRIYRSSILILWLRLGIVMPVGLFFVGFVANCVYVHLLPCIKMLGNELKL